MEKEFAQTLSIVARQTMISQKIALKLKRIVMSLWTVSDYCVHPLQKLS